MNDEIEQQEALLFSLATELGLLDMVADAVPASKLPEAPKAINQTLEKPFSQLT